MAHPCRHRHLGSRGSSVAWFTVILARVGRQQIGDARILQRAYLSVEPKGIEWSNNAFLVGQVAFKNVGKLPATEFISVVKKIMVENADWKTPTLTDSDLPNDAAGLVPMGAEVSQGSEGLTTDEVNAAKPEGYGSIKLPQNLRGTNPNRRRPDFWGCPTPASQNEHCTPDCIKQTNNAIQSRLRPLRCLFVW
jgi:hypothetical protein